MKVSSHNVTLSPQVSAVIESQVANGRFKDFSAAVQEAAYNYFIGCSDPFDEYGVTPEQVEARHERDLAEIREARKAGTLKQARV